MDFKFIIVFFLYFFICSGQVTQLQVRLMGGSTTNEGRVEVRYNGIWGTICDDNFNIHTATVICGMLQLPTGGALPRSEGFFGQGSGPIWLDDVNCLGNETSVAMCGHNTWGDHDCEHSEDAGVVCENFVCKAGWLFNSVTKDCYKKEQEKKSWYDARDYCLNLAGDTGATLTSIRSSQEQQFLSELIGTTRVNYWVGAHDRIIENSWEWVDKTPWWRDIRWEPGNPDDWRAGEDCGMIRILINGHGGVLNDAPCKEKNRFICRKKATDVSKIKTVPTTTTSLTTRWTFPPFSTATTRKPTTLTTRWTFPPFSTATTRKPTAPFSTATTRKPTALTTRWTFPPFLTATTGKPTAPFSTATTRKPTALTTRWTFPPFSTATTRKPTTLTTRWTFPPFSTATTRMPTALTTRWTFPPVSTAATRKPTTLTTRWTFPPFSTATTRKPTTKTTRWTFPPFSTATTRKPTTLTTRWTFPHFSTATTRKPTTLTTRWTFPPFSTATTRKPTTLTTATTTPVTTTTTVLCPNGWLLRPESDSCYRFWSTPTKTWTEAQETCSNDESNLLKLDSQAEKDWIISRVDTYPYNYEWWLGLKRHGQDAAKWQWTDGSIRNENNKFIQWGPGEPNNYQNEEDCAQIGYYNFLNDLKCTTPKPFICERPTYIDECKTGTANCDITNGICTNTDGSFSCACISGFTGVGISCTDIDECKNGTDNCDITNGICTNTDGSFSCACNSGFTGDGISCTDILTTSVSTTTSTSNTSSNTTYQNTIQHVEKSPRKGGDDNSGLTGGQIAGIVIGIIGVLLIISVAVYVIKTKYLKKALYPVDDIPLGFDNAVFNRSQETVFID